MRDPGTVVVDESIIHLVRRAESGGLVLSTGPLNLTQHKSFRSFLEHHIKNSLEDDQTHTAKFLRDAAETVVCSETEALLAGKTDLTRASSNIARHLHRITERQRTTSESAFACCLYSADGAADPYLALLKLDPSGAFRPVSRKDQHGKTFVDLVELDDVLPSERERLQKAALIRSTSTAKSRAFDLMVLDRQKRGGTEPADYFMKFLVADVAIDARTATRAFYNTMHQGAKDAAELLGENGASLVLAAARVAINSDKVNPTDIINTLRIPNTAKEILRATVLPAVQDKSFRPDPEVAQKLTRVRVFKGSYNTKLTIDSSAAEDRSVFSTKQEGSSHVITLRLPDWREVPR